MESLSQNNLLAKVQTKPQLFIKKVLGCNLEIFQERICDEVANFDRVAVSACHAVGKTFLLARIALWFLYCFRNSIVITTAPTARQVEMLLWGEIGVAVKNALYNLGGSLSGTKLQIADKWYALGFSPKKEAGGDDSKEQKGSTFQGWHGDYILIIFDEAVGVPADIWTQVEGLLTSGKIVKFVCIANPTTKNCNFYGCFQLASWRKVYLSCFDSPNLIANGITDKVKLLAELAKLNEMGEDERLNYIKGYMKPVPHLLSCQWVMDKLLEWGIDHPLFQSKVLGEFPDIDESTIVQLGDVETAQARTHLPKKKAPRFIGVDVARYGDDKTVFTELTDTVHTRTKTLVKRDTMHVTGELVNFIKDDYAGEDIIVCIDATGIGSGVYDRLNELTKTSNSGLPKTLRVVEIHFGSSVKQLQRGAKATDKEELEQATYANLKALMFFDLATALKSELRLRKEAVYQAELPTIKYKFSSAGKTLVESKDEYKKRTGKKSPDYSDSLALANLARRYRSYSDYLSKLVGQK